MFNPVLPKWLSKHRFSYRPETVSPALIEDLRLRLARYQVDNPEISIVVPAYNEEANLLNTLSSLADQKLSCATELLVVNNNSSDRTQEFLDRCGVRSVFERKPGVAHARQAGLYAARGSYIANADSDCIYPAGWAAAITDPLRREGNACTYGLYSFLPSPHSSRLALEFYEKAAHFMNGIRNRNKAYLNVYGFNFAFRRADALAVGGFEVDSGREGSVAELIAAGITPPPSERCEDGLMAIALVRDKKGIIYRVAGPDAHVWTSDRRLVADGSLSKAFANRVRKSLREMGFYLSPSREPTS